MQSNIDLIDKYLKEKDGREKLSHYPTDAESCIRKLYYAWNNTPISDPLTPASLYRMSWGDAIQYQAVKLLREAGGIILFENLPVIITDSKLEYPIHGYIDAVTQKEDGSIWGWEIKSSYGRGIRNIVKNKYPKENDLSQVLIYTRADPHYEKIKEYRDGAKMMAYVKSIFGGNRLNHFELTYFARDDAYRTDFIVWHKAEYHEYLNGKKIDWNFQDIIDKFQGIEKAIKSKQIPNRPYHIIVVNGEYRAKVWQDANQVRLTKPYSPHPFTELKSAWNCDPLYCKWSSYCWADKLKEFGKGVGL